jgi:P27 family predicted phage terminase small subunit
VKGRKPSTIAAGSSTVVDVPRPPTWLSKDAKAEWRRIIPDLVDRRILTAPDMGLLETYCVSIGRVREIERQIQAAGLIDPKLFRMQDKATETARRIADLYGLTPASRSRPAVRDDTSSDDDWLN